MTRELDLPATILALQDGGIDTAAALMRDPNPSPEGRAVRTTRIIEALCVRHDVPALFKGGLANPRPPFA